MLKVHWWLYINKLKTEQDVELSVISFNTEGGGVEANGLGEKLEKDRTAQSWSLHGHTHLQTRNEPLWWHGKTAEEVYLTPYILIGEIPSALINLFYIYRLMRSSGRLWMASSTRRKEDSLDPSSWNPTSWRSQTSWTGEKRDTWLPWKIRWDSCLYLK